jgi:hypothetical protein
MLSEKECPKPTLMSVMKVAEAKVNDFFFNYLLSCLLGNISLFCLIYSTGCGRLYVMDGNWKLCYAHCMFPVLVKIAGYEKEINYPNICPQSPQYQSAFCERHHNIVKNKGMPTDLKQFLLYCRNKKQGLL